MAKEEEPTSCWCGTRLPCVEHTGHEGAVHEAFSDLVQPIVRREEPEG